MLAAILAFIGGAAVAFLNEALSRTVLKNHASHIGTLHAVRQIIHVVYLIALYFLAAKFALPPIPLLIGGALGIALPPKRFTKRPSDDEE